MPWAVAAAGVSVAGSIGSGILGSQASASAARSQQAAQQQTLNWIQQVYGQTSSNLQPFIGAGTDALTALKGFYGLPGGDTGSATAAFQNFQNTPTYQFPLQQANLATNRALAASGLTNSGGALRDISQLNAGYASQGLSQYLSGLGSLASGGQNAAGQLASAGSGTYSGIGSANTASGNAGAAGTIGGFNSISQGVQSALPYITGTSSSSYGNTGLIGAAQGAWNNYQNSSALSDASAGYNNFQAGNPFGS